MPDNTVTIVAMNRPDLFRATLSSLVKCGLDDWHVFIALEPGPEQSCFKPVCDEILGKNNYVLTLNTKRLGIRANPYSVINRAFDSGSELNVCLEEDFLLAPDALQSARWYKKNHRPRWACLNLMAGTCGSAGNLSHPEHINLLFETRCFNSIGVVFTRQDWNKAKPYWSAPTTMMRGGLYDIHHFGWDWALLAWILQNPELYVVQPVAARCTHTGTEGTYCHEDFQKSAFGRLILAAPSSQQTRFIIHDIDSLPPLTAAHAHSQNDATQYLSQLLAMNRPEKSRFKSWAAAANRWRKFGERQR